MKRRLFFIVLFFVLLLQSGIFAEGKYPQRIVSLGPVITEELFLLGLDDALVACTIYCQRPREAKNKEKIGTVIEANVEKIVALCPDIVFATSLTNPRVKQKLKDLGIKTVEFPAARNFSEICANFLELGGIVGKEEEAQSIVNAAKNKVDELRKKTCGLPKPKVFIQVGAKPLVTITQDSFVNDFIEFAGGSNVVKELRYARYSREKVLLDNPEIILITTMGINGEEEKKIWENYKGLKAAQDNRIYILDSYLLCSPTPVSFVETLEKIANLFHPQI